MSVQLARPGAELAAAMKPDSTWVAKETARVEGIYDRMAPRYDAIIAVAERLMVGDGRRWACAGATGQVLEVAVGTGRNLPFYPRNVELTGVELSAAMLARAQAAAERLARPVNLLIGDAQHLDFHDASFDTVIATLALCSIPDDSAAVREMARVLRPGGHLFLLEHVASRTSVIRTVQRLMDAPLVRLLGDHLLREPDTAVRAAGLVVDEYATTRWGVVSRLAAHKPT